jgi:myosin heavy subunit
MCAKRENQSVIVCGESGSGKTESAKLFMKFLAYTSTKVPAKPMPVFFSFLYCKSCLLIS